MSPKQPKSLRPWGGEGAPQGLTLSAQTPTVGDGGTPPDCNGEGPSRAVGFRGTWPHVKGKSVSSGEHVNAGGGLGTPSSEAPARLHFGAHLLPVGVSEA